MPPGRSTAGLRRTRRSNLAALGGQIGMRIGTVRAFEKTQLQAATDSLTGLPNRRTLEEELRILAAAGQTYALVGRGPSFTCSFGISDSSMSSRPEELIQLADLALYQAKASGHDRACLADPSVQAEEPMVRNAELSPRGINNDANATAMG